MRAHRLLLRGAVPALAVRVTLFAVSVAVVGIAEPFPLWFWVAVVLAGVGAVFPRTFAAWGVIPCVGVAVLSSEPEAWRTAILVLGVHLIHVLASVTWIAPWSAWITLSAMRPSFGRMLAVELIVQPVILVIGLIPRVSGAGFAWLAPLGALAIVGVAMLMRRVHDEGEQPR